MRIAVLALMLLAVSACSSTSLRPVEDFSPSKIVAEIKVGDQIRVTTLLGKVFELEVTGVEPNVLHGKTPEGKAYRVDYEVIRTIEVKRVSGWKLVAGTGTTLIVAMTAIVIYAIVAFFSAL